MAMPAETNSEERSLRSPADGSVAPPVDVRETPQGYRLLADLPGVRADGLDIHVERNRLTIHARVTPPNGAQTPQHREFALRDYYRVFTLADEIDTQNIQAILKDGVLRLELPKAAHAQVRRIQVAAD